jgi:hypothetical protein
VTVLQPNPEEPDPLLAFGEEEHSAATAEAVPPVEKGAELPAKTTASAGPEPDGELRRRLDRLERQFERTLIDLASLKSDLATLVSAVDDIKKRTTRPALAHRSERGAVVAMPRRPPGPKTIAAIATLLIAGAAVWGLVAVATVALAEPVPIESEPLRIIELPPAVRADPPDRRARPPGETDRPRGPLYVGTLTVDAEPAGEVYLNRKPVGRTPLRLANLRAGSHLIWIQREGYRRFTRVVPVAANSISRVTASLDPISR